jgi:hypothetical protein
MRRTPIALLGSILILLVPGIGCNDDDSPTAPANPVDTLTVQNVSPPSGATVAPGTVRCQGTLRWNLVSSETGRLVLMSWWDGRILQTLATENLQEVNSRLGETTFSVLVALPAESAGRTRRLRFMLLPQGAVEPSASFEVN